MNQTTFELLITILIISIGTFLTRILPFALFPPHKKTPLFITYLGSVLPFAIIGLLIVYCFQSVSLITWPHGFPEIIASAFVIFVHKWKHNLLFSVGGGTILYMILVQYIFI